MKADIMCHRKKTEWVHFTVSHLSTADNASYFDTEYGTKKNIIQIIISLRRQTQ